MAVKSITCLCMFFCIRKDGNFSPEIHLAYMDYGTKRAKLKVLVLP